jgi:hypothetical protein
MKATAHIGVSALAAAAAYEITASGPIAVSLFISGVLIDLDHLPDYLLLAKEKFSFRSFFSWYHDRKWQKIYIVFHSYELMALLVMASFWLRNGAFIGMTSGCLLHMVMDQIGNIRMKPGERLSPWFYFFLHRCQAGFEKKNLTVDNPSE